MIPYARLSPGPGFAPERALGYYAQRLVTHPASRRAVARAIAAGVNLRAAQPPRAGDSASKAVLAALDEKGVSLLAPLAPTAAIDRMNAYFDAAPVIGPDGRPTRLADLPPDTPAAGYDLETVVNCPGLLALVNAPHIMEIASAYLGCRPTISSLGVRWSFPTSDHRARFHAFHRDIDDWRFLKVFIYLTDVDELSGPHCYVARSHRTGFGLRERSYARKELEARYGAEQMTTITGPRGTSFIADTIGVHCGEAPIARPRLMIQVQYSVLPVFAFQYSPVPGEDFGVDPYSNRLLVAAASPRAAPRVLAANS